MVITQHHLPVVLCQGVEQGPLALQTGTGVFSISGHVYYSTHLQKGSRFTYGIIYGNAFIHRPGE